MPEVGTSSGETLLLRYDRRPPQTKLTALTLSSQSTCRDQDFSTPERPQGLTFPSHLLSPFLPASALLPLASLQPAPALALTRRPGQVNRPGGRLRAGPAGFLGNQRRNQLFYGCVTSLGVQSRAGKIISKVERTPYPEARGATGGDEVVTSRTDRS